MLDFNQLSTQLEQLAAQAKALDHQRGENHKALFDERLFRCQARLLLPCVQEATVTLQTLTHEIESEYLTPARAEYLSERLLAQLGAIYRELSTVKIRGQEVKHSSYYRKPINTLYQELAQHQEWTRRLQEMVLEKQQQLNQTFGEQRTQVQKQLLHTEQRLERCIAAMNKLENQITYREKHQ